MKYILLLTLLWAGIGSVRAQDSTAVKTSAATDTVPAKNNEADALLAGLTDSTESQPLLPRKMIFTQRAFWGPKGLLRVMNVAPLTAEGRARELKIRRTMLVTHQIGGFVTLAGFIAQGLLGAKLYNARGQEYVDTKIWHQRSATFINIAYGTTLALSLTSPPPVVGAKPGFTSIKLHKYLAIVHLTGMIATNVLAHMIDQHPDLKPVHRAVAYGTFGAYAASVISLTF
ncbi:MULTISPECIES: hypothetical protein [Spirosoma]|uniref:Cytochrome b561 domain-containing protein n=1 Tax=Spirosoma liriopis TaxID=2937440 RepID=A0ABT0HH25_9BACT|nr:MULTISPECIES: hypothetical protein [Spirosoma]MCK8491451.1 hypothetical protein [Spirosoma liriopis]UHG90818.1 hypothetical protein LQ777_21560 [Spirosoma oryzicola]